MRKKTILIIITGFPGTGKTTLGKKIASKFKLPFICKDDFKEILFDILGSKDREWSKRIGMASYDILYHITEENLKANKSLIIETNFDPKFANKKIMELQLKYGFIPFQIRCIAEGSVLIQRFKDRANSSERHKGHCDGDNLDEWSSVLKKGKIEPLEINGETFDLDTTYFKSIDYEVLFNAIKKVITSP